MVRKKIRNVNKVTKITSFSGQLKMKKEKLYKGKLFEINAYYMQVEHRKVRREVIEHPGAAAMLAFDEKGKVLLVKQHRFPHGYILEIPAGTLEKGEKPIDCAYREIIEETGYKAKKMTKLVSYFPSVGYNKEEIHIFVASGTKKEFDLKLDNDEFITVVKMDIKKLIGMIKTGKIIDSKTICAVMIYAAKKKLL
jgi:ADP-ribose pyrophosphatase